jgi:uncharacterized Zn-binding protein involved in type VI secretion
MPGFLYHVGATAICPHGGQITVASSNARVLVNGMPVATIADTYPIAGCVFTLPAGKPQPCILARYLVPAARVVINGQPALIQTSTGLCQSAEQIPQGPPSILVTQTRVVAS